MRKYYLSFFESPSFKWMYKKEKYLKINAENTSELYDKLSELYPDVEINIEGVNYEYVNNATYFFDSGFDINNLSIYTAIAPAPTNQDFFYIVGFKELSYYDLRIEAKELKEEEARIRATKDWARYNEILNR